MIDPLLLLVLGVGLPVVARLGVAAAEVWMLRARARLATAVSRLPTGAELGGHSKDGTMWFVRIQGAATTGAEASGDR
ncbi:hypothetical protein [Spirillospora sp. NPDC029432]|uniref:hypothetical protein n=1 Tax=Spirillospora sp. NPDC029432 TaxID=3154599 RepID=UPI003454A6A7